MNLQCASCKPNAILYQFLIRLTIGDSYALRAAIASFTFSVKRGRILTASPTIP